MCKAVIPLSVYEYLSTRVSYDPETGLFRHLPHIGKFRKNDRVVGKVAGALCNGYIKLEIWDDRVPYRLSAHRLAWFMYYGKVPEYNIDHINGIRNDNRIVNLRDVPEKINSRNRKPQKNNTSGYHGVIWSEKDKRWHAKCGLNKKTVFIGSFTSKEEAAAASRKFRQENGFTDIHGVRQS